MFPEPRAWRLLLRAAAVAVGEKAESGGGGGGDAAALVLGRSRGALGEGGSEGPGGWRHRGKRRRGGAAPRFSWGHGRAAC